MEMSADDDPPDPPGPVPLPMLQLGGYSWSAIKSSVERHLNSWLVGPAKQCAPPPSAGLTSGGSVYGQPLDKLAAEQVCESGKICPSGDFGVATLAALCLALAAGCFVRAG